MTLIREFDLYLNAGKAIPLLINVNQFDSGEQWVFTLYKEDGTQYTPSTGAIVGIKSDGLGIINSGSVVDGKVVINETEQMTAAAGKAVFELLIDSQTHGTANFVVLVEPKPGNNADLSESDLSLLQEAIDATSPLPTGGTVGQVLTKTAQGSAWSDAGTPTQEQVAEAVSDWADEHITVETGVVIDTSLSVAGAAADAKKTGDEISDLKSQINDIEEEIEGGTGSGLTDEIKEALLRLARKVAYIDEDGQEDYDVLYDALYPPIAVTSVTLNEDSISFVDIGSTRQLTATVLPSDATETLFWSSSNDEIATVSDTGLVTAVAYGNATITALAGSISANCSVVIEEASITSISAVYTQSGAVYDSQSLDVLKNDLVVTAYYDNSTSEPVSEYELSGTLSGGTNTITVSYGGETTTFSVNVTATPVYPLENGTHSFTSNNRSLTVTNGNHFSFANNSAKTTGTGGYIRLDKVSANNTSGTSNTNYFSDIPWFTIPAGAQYTFEFKNITAEALDTGLYYNVSFKSNQTAAGIETGDRRKSSGNYTVTRIASEDINITTLGLYVKNSYSLLEGDVTLTVDGVRYI